MAARGASRWRVSLLKGHGRRPRRLGVQPFAILALVVVAGLASSCAAPSSIHETGAGPRGGPQGLAEGPIVAFGDSYTEGFGASAGESYPVVLAASLGVEVVNKGISGQTAAEALPRLGSDVVGLRPRLAIVEFGANEAFRGYPLSACLDALDLMLGELRSHGIPVLLVGVHTAAFQLDFDEALRALSIKHGTGLVLDVLDGTLDDARYVAPDGYHPNGPGYRIMESRIRPEVERMLALPLPAPAQTGS